MIFQELLTNISYICYFIVMFLYRFYSFFQDATQKFSLEGYDLNMSVVLYPLSHTFVWYESNLRGFFLHLHKIFNRAILIVLFLPLRVVASSTRRNCDICLTRSMGMLLLNIVLPLVCIPQFSGRFVISIVETSKNE